jgi:uncharacterized DUF497 family protein
VLYEWDDKKNKENIAKHGFDFTDAWRVFEDPDRITFEDDRKDYKEKRYITIGKVNKLITASICYTNRNGITRIISFRLASKKERRAYYGNG